MLVLPIPMFVAIVLGYLVVRSASRRSCHPTVLLLIGLCALQSLVVALVQYYGVAALRPVQPVTASLIPPLAWLAFLSSTRRRLSVQPDTWHALGPMLTLFSVVAVPALLDVALPALFIFYGIMIVRAVAQGGDSLPAVRLESGDWPIRLWQCVAIVLLCSALSDILIVMDQILGQGKWMYSIVSVFASINLLILGMVGLSPDLGRTSNTDAVHEMREHRVEKTTGSESIIPSAAPDTGQVGKHPLSDSGAGRHALDTANEDTDTLAETAGTDQTAAVDAATVAALDSLLNEQKLYLDPDLNLVRLARKLGVPVKQLSAAINRHSGENVSRYINRFRIEHACKLLLDGQSITQTLHDSGFNTKSNFNREFLRLKQISPSSWVKQAHT